MGIGEPRIVGPLFSHSLSPAIICFNCSILIVRISRSEMREPLRQPIKTPLSTSNKKILLSPHPILEANASFRQGKPQKT